METKYLVFKIEHIPYEPANYERMSANLTANEALDLLSKLVDKNTDRDTSYAIFINENL